MTDLGRTGVTADGGSASSGWVIEDGGALRPTDTGIPPNS